MKHALLQFLIKISKQITEKPTSDENQFQYVSYLIAKYQIQYEV